MSKVFNMVGGGGKNISSIIITGLESTDTVTCTKDGKSYTATWDSTAQHWEIVGLPLGTFTITATNGTQTETATVLIDIAGVYEIEITYKFWLYREGDECEDLTGGFGVLSKDYGTSDIKQTNNLYLKTYYVVGSSIKYTSAVTNNKIDLSKYSKICMEVSDYQSTGDCANANMKFIGYSDSPVSVIDASILLIVSLANTPIGTEKQVISTSISITGSKYLSFGILATAGMSGTITMSTKVHKIWFE